MARLAVMLLFALAVLTCAGGMMLKNVSKVRTVMLFLPGKREIYPMSTAALTCAQGGRRKLVENNRGALILDRDGIRRIENLRILGPMGDSIGKKLIHFLSSTWKIEVSLSDVLPCTFDQIKQLMIDYAASLSSVDEWNGEGSDIRFSDFVSEVTSRASDLEELFVLMKLPSPENALDIL
jgi:hypothetical protein